MQTRNVALAIALAVAAAFLSGCNSLESTPRSDLEKLQGTWVGQELGRDAEVTMIFAGDTIEFQGARPGEWYRGTVVLYEDQSPRQADYTISECSFRDYVGKISKTIYALDGNTLTFAGAEPGVETRPGSFDASGMNRVFQLTLQPAAMEQ